MKTHYQTLGLALLGGMASLLMSARADAATIAYYGLCYPGTPDAQIIAAGHTPLALASAPNASNLAGVAVLLACEPVTDPGVSAAVANGMALIVHDSNYTNGSFLPGGANLVEAGGANSVNIDFTAAAPFINGPGGALTNASLDHGSSSNHGAKTTASLPAGASAWATTDNPGHVVTFGYGYGQGVVVFSTIPLQCYLGSQCASVTATVPGMKAYATNLIAWAESGAVVAPSTTCASEGYIGTQLTWCKNICEMGYSGATLNTWIRRWTDRYRTLPYCAVAPAPAPALR